MNLTLSPVLLLCAATIAGCASMPAPTNRLASSEAAIRGAREVGAESVPSASLYIKLSEEELASAKKLMADGNNMDADLQLQRSQADAELALSLARETIAETQAQALIGKVQDLRAKN